ILEIVIMLIGTAGFFLSSLWLLFLALLLIGVHSTLFGPVKYAILPQHLRPEELVGGNGLVEMGTFVASLIGTIAGGHSRRRAGSRRTHRDRRRHSRLARQPCDSDHAGGRSRPRPQLESVHRD